jgi:F420-dependent oxidoreductase-like protein
VDVGIHMINFTLPGGPEAIRGHVADTAEAAEEAGCTMFTFMDHYFQMEQFSRSEDPMLEGYTALGFVAGRTERMTLGLLVTGVTYRYPGLLAKIVTTLDVLSGGRAMLGLGAAWYEREHLGLGVPYPPISERFERLEETLQICLQMWSDNDGPFAGKHYQLAETLCVPEPVQKPRPRIMVGGSGERKTLRLVARYADANNLFATSPEEIKHKLEVLAEHCANEGRDPSEIQNTTLARVAVDVDVDEFVAGMAAYAELGMQHVQIVPLGPDPAAVVKLVGKEIVPRLAELPSAR